MSNIEKQKISIKGIFQKDDKFLVLKEDKNWWEFPGGKIELGESIDDCFAREIEEELGWKNTKMNKVVHIFTLNSESYKTQYIVICVKAEAGVEPIILSDEHIEYDWLTIDEIAKLDIFPDFLIALKKSS